MKVGVVAQSSGAEVPNSVLFAVLPLFVLLVGGIFWYVDAKGPILRARQFLGMRSFEPHGNDGEGLVALEGTVRATQGTVTAPLSGADCVAYDRADQAYRHGYKYDRAERRRLKRKGIDEDIADSHGYSWETTNSTSDSVPFRVETEHGPVAVDPSGAKTELPEKIDRKASVFYRLFYMIHPFTGRVNLISGLLMKLPGTGYLTPASPSREIEARLEPGDKVFVVVDGDGVETAAGETVGAIADGDHVDRYRVTVYSPLRLKLRSVGSALRASFVAIVALLLASVIVAAGVLIGAY